MEINKNNEFENAKLCIECGGMCCKNSGCGYLPRDFENMNFEYLKKRLEGNEISIVSTLNFYPNSRGQILSANPILHFRVRNTGKEIVDLFSKKTACSVLTDTGCPYSLENRPSGGVYLIPKKDVCQSIYPEEKQIEDWTNHQKVMQKLVKYYTGCSVEDQLKNDIINATAEMYMELRNLNGSVNNAHKEVKNILQALDIMSDLYKAEIKEGKEKGIEQYNKTFKLINLK